MQDRVRTKDIETGIVYSCVEEHSPGARTNPIRIIQLIDNSQCLRLVLEVHMEVPSGPIPDRPRIHVIVCGGTGHACETALCIRKAYVPCLPQWYSFDILSREFLNSWK